MTNFLNVEIKICTQDSAGNKISMHKIETAKFCIETLFNVWCGGYTLTKQIGGYVNNVGLKIVEDVFNYQGYYFYSSKIDKKSFLKRFRKEAIELKHSLSQESVLIIINGIPELI